MKWKFFAAAFAMFVAVGWVACAAPAHADSPKYIEYVVMPHEDDEPQAWSQIEGSNSNYKVFVYLTMGEETGFCSPTGYASGTQNIYNGHTYGSLGEIAPSKFDGTDSSPNVGALAKGSTNCKYKRMQSSLRFLNAMSATDSSVPGGFTDNPADDYKYNGGCGTNTLCFSGNSNSESGSWDGGVRVYNPTTNTTMGKVIFFNLGNNDGSYNGNSDHIDPTKLTVAKANWALSNIKSHKAELGIPTHTTDGVPTVDYVAVGPYSNTSYSACAMYIQPDHIAVHKALYGFSDDTHNTNANPLGVAYREASTCATDPDYVSNGKNTNVSSTQWGNMFATGTNNERIGYAQKYYGWMDSDPLGLGNATGSSQTATRGRPWMQHQTYWKRS